MGRIRLLSQPFALVLGRQADAALHLRGDAQHEPLAALAQRWTRDPRKLAATERLADLERDDEPAPVQDAARRAGTLLHSGWGPSCSAQPHERADLEDDGVLLPLRTPEEAARIRALARELAALGTPAWSPEPADGREFGDGLGLELEFE